MPRGRRTSVLVYSQRHLALTNLACEALAHAGGIEIHVALGCDPRWLGWSRRPRSLTRLQPETAGEAEVVHQLLRLARARGAEVLLPVATPDVALVSHHRAALAAAVRSVAVPAPDLLAELTDKARFARIALQAGAPVPRTLRPDEVDSTEEILARLSLPLIAKRVDGEGGRGSRLILEERELREFLRTTAGTDGSHVLQERVHGEDVALTLLADRGEPFAAILRRRWFTPPGEAEFAPITAVEFFQSDWLEALGREFVRATRFSGIADFDLKVDFTHRRAWFLECDPRLMGGTAAALRFGLNVPALLVEQALGRLAPGSCARSANGHFIATSSVRAWLRARGWRLPRRGPVRTGLALQLRDPLASLLRAIERG